MRLASTLVGKFFACDKGTAFTEGTAFFEVVIVAPGVGGEFARADVEHMRGQGADEVDVVADEDKGAFELFEGVNKCLDAGHVEVGGGLVHEQEVGGIEEDFDEAEAGFFAAGEDGDVFEDAITGEEEGAEHGAGKLLGHGVGAIKHGLQDGVFGVEDVHAVLGEVADDAVVAGADGAALWFEHAAKKFEEGGFAGAVGADEDDALTAFRLEVNALVNFGVAISEVHVFERDGALASARRLGEADAHAPFGVLRCFDFFHAFDLFEFALGLGGFAGLGAKAVGKALEGFDFFLLVLVGGEVLGLAGGALVEEVVVVAAVGVQAAVAQFKNAGDKGVEEGAIVRDHEEAAGVGLEVVLKPSEGLEIEVVGGLVKHEQVGLHHQ